MAGLAGAKLGERTESVGFMFECGSIRCSSWKEQQEQG